MAEKAAFLLEDSLIGQKLANFRIERLLKRGGMAQIYYGWDVMLQRPVAIKVIDVRYRSSPTYAERFLAEARAMAAWGHPNIVQIHYADEQDRLYYFVMEYVNGLDLAELVARYAADQELMPYRDVARIGREVARALDYAHEHGVIHRDVKPSNVMVARNGRVLLTDFGLALTIKNGSQGEIFGTPQYIAPEQAIRSAAAVPQSDLYSLGIILYEMLTGSLPFDDASPTSLALMHVNEDPPSPRYFNPHINPEVETVLLRALRKAPEERYQSGADFMDALELALQVDEGSLPGQARRPPLPAQSETGASQSPPTLSRVSVLEKIAWQSGLDTVLGEAADPAAAENGAVPTAVGRRFRQILILLTLVTAVLLLLLLNRANSVDEQEQTAAAIATAPGIIVTIADATATFAVGAAATQSPAAALAATLTDDPATLRPSFPVTSTAATELVTATTIPTTLTTSTPPVAVTTAVPFSGTAVPFSGPPIRFLYDQHSFYAWNPGEAPIDVHSLSFVALDQDGQTTSYAFRGRMWAGFYQTLETDSCDAIEPMEAPVYLRPSACTLYNATVTPPLNSRLIFWTPRPGITAFRVMWNGQTIGDCPIVAGICELNLPD
ncbi:MAG: serine/threonine protein kinase [Anaerolinea sp.]|nr:serine/threonine protein kinase [Anaerolinea sp.]